MYGVREWEMDYCHISKQGYHSHQQLQPSSEPVSPQGNQEEENICSLAAVRLQTLPKVSPEERKLRVWKQEAGPRQVRCKWKEWFQWAPTLASSHTQKSTKFPDWGYMVFFNNKLLVFRLPALRYKVLCNLVPLFTFWVQFSQGY